MDHKYQQLLKDIKEKGTYKPAAREGMPGTYSLFGYQFRHDLSNGFPLLTTKKMFWKGITTELCWFLRGDTNIQYLLQNDVNIWNEDAYNYYCKKGYSAMGFDMFISAARQRLPIGDYISGDCGKQYGWLWRNWNGVDQIKELYEGLLKNPMGRRHIVTAWNPETLNDMALNACHVLFQFNCRPIDIMDRVKLSEGILHRHELMFEQNLTLEEQLNEAGIPSYYLDCQLYQRSADVFLGVPFNIASYALLIELMTKMCNMIPGEFIHTFGDVHIYENHMEAVEEQLKREPFDLPRVKVNLEDLSLEGLNRIQPEVFELINYKCHPPIKAKLSTGLK